jgi:hypothetical protein
MPDLECRLGYADRMTSLSYRGHRFPASIIQHASWFYFRFTLSYRDVEELLAECGLDLTYETVRRWVLKFGCASASNRDPTPRVYQRLDFVTRIQVPVGSRSVPMGPHYDAHFRSVIRVLAGQGQLIRSGAST